MVKILPKEPGDINGLIHAYPKLFSIKASSSYVGTPENMITQSTNYWCSNNNENEYFTLSFSKPIYITNYTFRVLDWSKTNNMDYPKQWYGKGKYGKDEILMTSITKSGIVHQKLMNTYATNTTGPFSEITMTHYGMNYRDKLYFCLNKIELFGYLYKEIFCKTTRRRFFVHSSLLSMTFIMVS